jgi:hypothetical protein
VADDEILNDYARIVHSDGGQSLYALTHPTTGAEERFTRVTSPLEPVAKSALIPWASGLAAKAAYAQLPRLVASMLATPCGRTYNRCEHDFKAKCADCPCLDCQECLVRYLRDRHLAESYRRSDEGTRFHQVAASWIKTGMFVPYEPDIEPYIATFRRFIEELDLTPKSFEWAEAIVVNRTHEYAGQCDAGLWLIRGTSVQVDDLLDRLTLEGQPRRDKALLLGDWKTREDNPVNSEGNNPEREENPDIQIRDHHLLLSDE